MSYESWRITYQSAEQAARDAYAIAEEASRKLIADDAKLARIAELERENKKLNRCVDLAIRIFRDNGNHGYVKAMEELAGEKENG